MKTLSERLRQAAQCAFDPETARLMMQAAVALESAPKPQERKPLTYERLEEIEEHVWCETIGRNTPRGVYLTELARAIEAAHGINGASE